MVSKATQKSIQFENFVNALLPGPNVATSMPQPIVNPAGAPLLYSTRRTIEGGGGAGGLKSWAEQVAEGTASPDVAKAQKTLAENQARLAVGGKPSKSLLEKATGAGNTLLKGAAKGLMGGLDIIQRPAYAIENVLKEEIKAGQKASSHPENLGGLFNLGKLVPAFGRGITGKEKTRGSDILKEQGVNNSIARSLAGLGIDIIADPLSYISGGAGALAKGGVAETSEIVARSGLKGFRARRLAEGLEETVRATKGGAGRGIKKLTEAGVEGVTSKGVQALAETIPKTTVARKAGSTAYQTAINAGQTLQEANEAKRLAIEAITSAEVADFTAKARTAMEPLTQGSFKLRVGFPLTEGKTIAESRALYKPFEKAGTFIRGTKYGEKMGELFSFEKYLPEKLQYLRNKAVQGGFIRQKEQETIIDDLLRNVTPEQEKEIMQAIEKKIDLSGVSLPDGRTLEDVKQGAIDTYREMADEKVAAGILEPGQVADDTYTYHWYRNYRRRHAADEFRTIRRDALRKGGTTPITHNLDAAVNTGLKPEERVGLSLKAAWAKHNRDLSRTFWRTDVVEKYGLKANPSFWGRAGQEGYVQVPKKYLTPDQITLLGKGEKYYVPKKIGEAFTKMDDMLRLNNVDIMNSFLRSLDTVNRGFKFSRTVPRPAYHINNMLSDMLFSWLDGTPAHKYAQMIARNMEERGGTGVAKAWRLSRNNEISHQELMELYHTNAGGAGFHRVDLPETRNKLLNKARGFSEAREDFGRSVHFTDAFQDEWKKEYGDKLIHRGTKAWENALNKISERATQRVNQWNFDYGALTPFEQNIMKRVVPFYTYQRKAVPLMFQAMMLNPGRVTAVPKGLHALETLLGVDPGSFSPERMPSFLQEMGGFARLNNDQEPWVLNATNYPMFGLPPVLGESGGSQDVAGSLLEKLNPLLLAPFEVQRGKTYFANKSVNGPLDWGVQTFNPVTPALGPLLKEGKSPSQKLLEWTGQFRKITNEQQLASVKSKIAEQTPGLAEQNQALMSKGLEIRSTTSRGQKIYRLVYGPTGKVVGTFKSKADAQLAGNNWQG